MESMYIGRTIDGKEEVHSLEEWHHYFDVGYYDAKEFALPLNLIELNDEGNWEEKI
jgi:hypothetical protein